jgi:maleate isomerase
MNREAGRWAPELADARVDIMSTACLVAIMALGMGYHQTMEEELTAIARANHSLVPVMTSAGALSAPRISLMAPYMRPRTDLVVNYIEHEGIAVVDSLAFEIPDNLEVGLRDPLQLLEDIQRLNTADVVVASACVQMPSLPAVQHIENMLGIPTVSTAICTTWSMLDQLGLETVVPEAGALLSAEKHLIRANA